MIYFYCLFFSCIPLVLLCIHGLLLLHGRSCRQVILLVWADCRRDSHWNSALISACRIYSNFIGEFHCKIEKPIVGTSDVRSSSSSMACSASVVFLFSPGLLRLPLDILLPWSSCDIFCFRGLLVTYSTSVVFLFSPGLLWHILLPWSSCSPLVFYGIFCFCSFLVVYSASVVFLFSPGLLRLP